MSGGIDSCAAAFLLQQQGHDIAGITMDLGEYGMVHTPEGATIAAPHAARHVCDYLGIPHHTVKCSTQLNRNVISRFTSLYRKGKTPNPCVMCNETLKFPRLLNEAQKRGYDYIATGHYAALKENQGVVFLQKPVDSKKDQTYFLYRVPRDTLRHVLFPLATYTKEYLRTLISYNHIPVVYSHESQDICFIPHNDYRAFLNSSGISSAPGPIVDSRGTVLGRHNGIIHYTIGQRKGLGIAMGYPLYVIRIDSGTNTIVVGNKQELYSRELTASHINLLCDHVPEQVYAKIRYAHTPAPASCRMYGNTLTLQFDRSQRAITPGQSVVLYDGDTVLGGGYINAS